jgi:thiamine biosynthesis lipoprotein
MKRAMGFDKLHVRTQPPAIKKDNEKLRLDLSGIAKGYAVDEVAMLLSANGLKHFMVEIGGEVRAHGHKKSGGPWRIGIERPDAKRGVVQRILQISNEALATSGDYRNYYEQAGKRFSHLLDPTTGKPISHQVASVTVVAADCATADAYATAFMVMGFEKAKKIAQEQKLVALFLIRTADGFVEKTVGDTKQLVVK